MLPREIEATRSTIRHGNACEGAARALVAAGAPAIHTAAESAAADESAADAAAAADVVAAEDAAEDDEEGDLEDAGVAGACGLRNGLRTRQARIFAIVSFKPIACLFSPKNCVQSRVRIRESGNMMRM